MKPFFSYALAMAVVTGITLSSVRPAHAELVFENDLAAPAAQAPPVQAPAASGAQSGSAQGDISPSEQMRRQRLRTELKNEDLLTQKLEQLRLKEEMKRTDELLGSGVAKEAQPAEPLQEQRVGSVAVPASAPAAAVPARANSNLANTGPVGINGAPIDNSATNQSVTKTDGNSDEIDTLHHVSVLLRGGTSSIMNSIYQVTAKVSVGVGLSMDVNDFLAFTAGYTYTPYNIGVGSAFGGYGGYGGYGGMVPGVFQQPLTMNDNVIDMGARGYFTAPNSRVRPFVGLGGAYRRGYVNYPSATQTYLQSINPGAAQDVNISGFSGYIEAGLEFKLSKMLSLVGTARYFDVLSASQDNPLYGYAPDTRSAAGTALAGSNFVQLMGGVAFTF